MTFIKLRPTTNADGWTAYQVSFDLGLIIKSKPGVTRIEGLPRPFLLQVADEPDAVAGLILADLVEDDGVDDALLEEARDHLGAALKQALPEDDQVIVGHMREAHALLRAALKARRP